ncbi:hypothetical protein GCM10027432_27990 [Lysobacter fragariae]
MTGRDLFRGSPKTGFWIQGTVHSLGFPDVLQSNAKRLLPLAAQTGNRRLLRARNTMAIRATPTDAIGPVVSR